MGWIDWSVVVASCVAVFAVGIWFARRSSRGGLAGYFAGDRDLPWWSIGLSNTATYQSGNGAFVMLVMSYGLVGNWLWWASWIIWMPLAAVLWARLWQRTGVVSVAELISLRYGDAGPALAARKLFAAFACFTSSVLVIAYITGFFAKTVEPIVHMEAWQILLIFGGITVAYTMFGGLLGVVYTDVAQFAILVAGSFAFVLMAAPQFGGWGAIADRVATARPDALTTVPPASSLGAITLAMLVFQGFFNVGDGTTAQRFIAARSERHAVAGQLFNAYLALSLRTLPLIGMGLIALSIFWHDDAKAPTTAPAGFTPIVDPAFAWGELIRRASLPVGFVGLLVATEVAAYMSTLSSLINFGSGLVVNDLLPKEKLSERAKIRISRVTVLVLFVLSALMTIAFVDDMVSWFLFINATIGVFALPVAVMRFCWWRFNAWGELAATALSLPLAATVWFGLDFQHAEPWMALVLLLSLGVVTLTTVTLLTPAPPMESLRRFYLKCRPPGVWGPVISTLPIEERRPSRDLRLLVDGALGIAACLGLVLMTNAFWPGKWTEFAIGAALTATTAPWLIARVMRKPDAMCSQG